MVDEAEYIESSLEEVKVRFRVEKMSFGQVEAVKRILDAISRDHTL